MRLRAFLQWRIGVKLHPLSMLLDFGLQIRSCDRLEVGQECEMGHFLMHGLFAGSMHL